MCKCVNEFYDVWECIQIQFMTHMLTLLKFSQSFLKKTNERGKRQQSVKLGLHKQNTKGKKWKHYESVGSKQTINKAMAKPKHSNKCNRLINIQSTYLWNLCTVCCEAVMLATLYSKGTTSINSAYLRTSRLIINYWH